MPTHFVFVRDNSAHRRSRLGPERRLIQRRRGTLVSFLRHPTRTNPVKRQSSTHLTIRAGAAEVSLMLSATATMWNARSQAIQDAQLNIRHTDEYQLFSGLPFTYGSCSEPLAQNTLHYSLQVRLTR